MKRVLAAAVAPVVLVVPAADAAKPTLTLKQAKQATAKFVRKDSRLTPKTIICERTGGTGFKCTATAEMSSGGTCTVGVGLRNGKPWATGDKFTSRQPESCAEELD